MKKILKITLLLILLCPIIIQSQTTDILNLNYLGQPVSHCGNIYFNLSSIHNIQFDVKLSRPYYENEPNLGSTGTLRVLYWTGSGEMVEKEYSIGISSWTISGNNASVTKPVSITLNSNDFDNSIGGVLFARFHDATQNFYYESCDYNIIKPKFRLSPESITIDCNDNSSKTFSVYNVNNIPGSLSYNWNVGTGWKLNGNPVSGIITTNSNSIHLTPTTSLLSNISVTTEVDGATYPEPLITVITRRNISQTITTIYGASTLCTGISNFNFGSNTILPGQAVSWSLSNTNVATISGSSNTGVNLNVVGTGTLNLTATISDVCGKYYSVTKNLIVGSPMPTMIGSTCFTESAPCGLNATANNNYLLLTLSAILGTYVPQNSDWQWEKISGNFYFLENGQYNSNTHTGKQGNIYLTGANPTNNALRFKCRVKNACGWGPWRYFVWNDGTTTPPTPPTPPSKYYSITPNPTGSSDAHITLKNANAEPNTYYITARLYSTYGQLLSTTQLFKNGGVVPLYSYPYNIMYLSITFAGHSESHTIVRY